MQIQEVAGNHIKRAGLKCRQILVSKRTKEFLYLGTVDTLRRKICFQSCHVHCRVFSNIPGPYPLDASHESPIGTHKNDCRHCPMSPRGQNHPQLKNPGPKPKMENWFQPKCKLLLTRSSKPVALRRMVQSLGLESTSVKSTRDPRTLSRDDFLFFFPSLARRQV